MYNSDPLPVIKSAVNKLVDFIKPTYGPSNYKVMIDGQLIVDDGQFIAKQFKLDDELENSIINIVRQTSQKTNDRVGDGTTGSLILLQALLNEGSTDLDTPVKEAKEQLLSKATKISTVEELTKVAEVSCNNPEIASIIADTIFKVGADGVVNIQEGDGTRTVSEVVTAYQYDSGFYSPYMVRDAEKMETILENPYILISDKKLYYADVLEVINQAVDDKKDLLILAELDDEALKPAIINHINRVLNVVVVKPEGSGRSKSENLQDIATLVGGVVRTEVEKGEFGQAKKVIIKKNSTTILEGAGNVVERVAILKEEVEGMIGFDKDQLQQRIGKLTNGIALIKVGGFTENETRALRFKIEDSVNATKLAFKSGVVPGAGKALSQVETSNEAFNKALKIPEQILKDNCGELGEVSDPVEVVIASLESAVSIAKLLLSTKGIINNA